MKALLTPMLAIESLSFAFQHIPLFRDVTLRTKPGDVIHLTGPNGAGKSTFMSVVAGYRRPTTGTIRYLATDGEEVDDRRKFLEFLPAEANGLYGRMDAVDNLLFWARLRGKSLTKDQVYPILSEWGLGHALVREKFPVEKFSTGMKRRLALARVELSGCPVWLLDEPIYGLDAKGISLFQSLLSRHKAEGGMAIMISHDLAPIQGLITGSQSLKGENS